MARITPCETVTQSLDVLPPFSLHVRVAQARRACFPSRLDEVKTRFALLRTLRTTVSAPTSSSALRAKTLPGQAEQGTTMALSASLPDPHHMKRLRVCCETLAFRSRNTHRAAKRIRHNMTSLPSGARSTTVASDVSFAFKGELPVWARGGAVP